jgi:hypothetical protein
MVLYQEEGIAYPILRNLPSPRELLAVRMKFLWQGFTFLAWVGTVRTVRTVRFLAPAEYRNSSSILSRTLDYHYPSRYMTLVTLSR